MILLDWAGMAENEDLMAESCLVEVTPVKEFVTYGVGVSLVKMRDPKQARGRASVGVETKAEMPV